MSDIIPNMPTFNGSERTGDLKMKRPRCLNFADPETALWVNHLEAELERLEEDNVKLKKKMYSIDFVQRTAYRDGKAVQQAKLDIALEALDSCVTYLHDGSMFYDEELVAEAIKQI